jgi:hypothetical protein
MNEVPLYGAEWNGDNSHLVAMGSARFAPLKANKKTIVIHPSKRSTSQPTNQPTKQTNKQPIKQTHKHTTKQPTDQP